MLMGFMFAFTYLYMNKIVIKKESSENEFIITIDFLSIDTDLYKRLDFINISLTLIINMFTFNIIHLIK